MPRVMIDDWVWERIMEHYAQLEAPTEDDKRVIRYIVDKESRRLNHDLYMSQKRLNELIGE